MAGSRGRPRSRPCGSCCHSRTRRPRWGCDGQPSVVSASIEMAAPASRIFDILADPRRHVEIDGSHMLRRCLDGPDRLGCGSEFVVSMRLWSVPYRVRNRVVEFEENRLIAWRHFEPQHWRFELQPTQSGTRVTETFDYSYWPLRRPPPPGCSGLAPKKQTRHHQDTRATRKRSPGQPNRSRRISSRAGWPPSGVSRRQDLWIGAVTRLADHLL